MPRPLQVGITGGIGSGKSIIAKIFIGLGIPVYDADSRAKILMNTDEELMNQIINAFGNQSYDKNGRLNRRYLAEHVFGFPDRLEKLNRLVHPRVEKDYTDWVNNHKSQNYLLKEAALLFESGAAKKMDTIIVVTAPDTVRIHRVAQRDGRSEEEIRNIMSRQLAQDKIVEQANFVIVNDESELVVPQILELHQKFKQRSPIV